MRSIHWVFDFFILILWIGGTYYKWTEEGVAIACFAQPSMNGMHYAAKHRIYY